MGIAKRTIGSLVLVLICVLADGPARTVGATPSDAFDPSGDYHIADRALSALVDRFYFDIEVRRSRGRFVAWGHVYARSTFYKISAITVSQEHLIFKTSTVRGVAYRFEGRFTRKGSFAAQFEGNGIIAIKGTMMKVINGNVDRVATSEYLYYPGC